MKLINILKTTVLALAVAATSIAVNADAKRPDQPFTEQSIDWCQIINQWFSSTGPGKNQRYRINQTRKLIKKAIIAWFGKALS